MKKKQWIAALAIVASMMPGLSRATETDSVLTVNVFGEHGSALVEVNGIQRGDMSAPVSARMGDSITLTAIAAEHYMFEAWRVLDVEDYITEEREVEVIDSVRYTVDQDGVEIWDTVSHREMRMVEVPVYTERRRAFDNPLSLFLEENVNVEACFSPLSYAVTLTGDYVTFRGAGVYRYGDTVEVSARGTDFRHFTKWTKTDGTEVSRENPYRFVLNGEIELVAETEFDLMSLRVNASQGGRVTGGGEYPYGSEAVIEAIPEQGYRFYNWSDGDTQRVRSVYMYGGLSFTAYFERVGIEQGREESVRVRGGEGRVEIEGAEGKRAKVMDMMGREYYSGTIEKETIEIGVPSEGVYFIMLDGGKGRKVIVRSKK